MKSEKGERMPTKMRSLESRSLISLLPLLPRGRWFINVVSAAQKTIFHAAQKRFFVQPKKDFFAAPNIFFCAAQKKIICAAQRRFFVQHKKRFFRPTHVVVSTQSESDGGDVERVGDEVDDVPHVADVLLQPDVPQLLDLTPYQTSHPNLVAVHIRKVF